jgi:phytoene synthase
METALQESYRQCEAITRERAQNFFFGIRLLPQERRISLCAAYAFFRTCDDIADGDIAVEDRAKSLELWARTIDPKSGEGADGPGKQLLPAFHDTVRRYAIPLEYFYDLVRGAQDDLVKPRYQTFDELYRYCYRVASTVGVVCLHVFGFDGSAEALKQAEHRGIAFQLTNILRDVAEDLSLGRIYLPLDDLARFGVDPDQLVKGTPGPGFANLIQFEVERARHYYELSDGLRDRVDAVSRPSLQAMTGIYRQLLEKIAILGPGVLTTRASLTKMEKLKLAGQTVLDQVRA